MTRIIGSTLGVLCLVVSAFGQVTATSDPTVLLERAKQLVVRNPTQEVISQQIIPLLREADAEWLRSSSNDSRYAESLDLLAVLLLSGEADIDPGRREVPSLAARAAAILEPREDQRLSGEYALALELQASALGREKFGAGTDFWNRATKIRGQLVANVERIVRSASSDPDAGVVVQPNSAIYRVGNGVSAPSVIFKMNPQYPETARLAKQAGSVILSVVVTAGGKAANIVLLRGCGFGLDEKAAETVLQWRFTPGMKEGTPVNVRATIEVTFKLI